MPIDDAIYIYSRDGGDKSFLLPDGWREGQFEAATLTRDGRWPAPAWNIEDGRLKLRMLPRMPVKLWKKPAI